jgi:hypothetical protein
VCSGVHAVRYQSRRFRLPLPLSFLSVAYASLSRYDARSANVVKLFVRPRDHDRVSSAPAHCAARVRSHGTFKSWSPVNFPVSSQRSLTCSRSLNRRQHCTRLHSLALSHHRYHCAANTTSPVTMHTMFFTLFSGSTLSSNDEPRQPLASTSKIDSGIPSDWGSSKSGQCAVA